MDPFQVLKTVGRTKALPLAQQLLLALLFNLIAQGSLVSSLSCYHCGELSSNARAIQDCAGVITVQQCQPDEACVVFKRLYLKGSESIRGCFPRNKNLPGLSGASITPTDNCDYSPKGRSPVKVCMCTEELCNANDYNIHVDRATPIVGDGRITTGFNNSSATNAFNNARTTESIPSGEIPRVICQTLNVLGATYANCDGQYSVTPVHVDWAPNRPVYRHLNKDRYIFWNAHGLGWSIGKRDYLKTGSHWHRSGLDTDEPWQGTWSNGVFVECVGKQEDEPTVTSRPIGLQQQQQRQQQQQQRQQQQQQQQKAQDGQGPVNCLWSGFGEWSRCSVSCGAGTQQRKRMVLQPARNGGQECLGDQVESRPCSQVACPVDCEWNEFDEWTTCSATCGGGIQRRRRTVSVRASNGGIPCRGRDVESRDCNTQPCIIDCKWSEPSAWSPCNISCGLGGVETRTRQVARPAKNGGRPCEGDPIEARPCESIPECPTTTTQATTETTETTTTVASKSTSSKAEFDESLTSEERKVLDESFIEKLLDAINDVTGPPGGLDFTTESGSSVEIATTTNTCCDRIVVKAFGPAKDDQSLYLGTYKKITSYNGKTAYEKEGSDQLYIYFFVSQPDKLSLWVIGPELGKFIAGIRNDGSPACVHDATEKWRYASRAGLWKEDDPTLQVKCYTPEDEVDSLAFGVRKTTTRLPVNNKTTQPADNSFEDDEDDDGGEDDDSDEVTSPTGSSDCVWSDYGPWSVCSAKCDQGTQTRFRTVLRRQQSGGKPCEGSSREVRSCNLQPCFIDNPTTSRSDVSTTTVKPTTSRPVEPRRDGRVKCFACGSLFSTDAPECKSFDIQDPAQQKTCEKGEACLWYTYQKSSSEKAVIRECFSLSILLGSIENPIEPLDHCEPQPVEDGDDTIRACVCTGDFCNGYKTKEEEEAERQTPRPVTTTTTPSPRSRTTTQPSRTNSENFFDVTTERPVIRPSRPDKPKPETNQVAISKNSDPNRVLCHQCGTLFSGSSGNSGCTNFDPAQADQRSYCKPGEACLWYSWQKAEHEFSTIRECFSPSILLGPISDPLVVQETCEVQDISETPGSSIMACLCNTDLCNSVDASIGDPVALPHISEPPRGSSQLIPTTLPPFLSATTSRPLLTTTPSRRFQPQSDDLSAEELVALTELGRIQGAVPEEPKSRPQEAQNRPSVTPQKPVTPPPSKTQNGGLRCFSCGSLLDPNRECATFNPADATQVQTCGQNEACLLYTWKKSPTETAISRECFPTTVLLGDFNDPLTPEAECQPRDISEPGTSGVTACLCTTSFCNVGDAPASGDPSLLLQNEVDEVTQRSTTRRTEVITTTTRPRLSVETTTRPLRTQPLQEQRQEPVRLQPQRVTTCPPGFELIGRSCYSFSPDRMGWIEAKKMCEIKSARLLVMETESERDDLLEYIMSTQGRSRSRFEFWTAGNDIERENIWVWSGQDEAVPEFGWIEQPIPSAEENCLTWDITISRNSIGSPRGRQINSAGQRFTEGWHSDSCCNSVRYICELA